MNFGVKAKMVMIILIMVLPFAHFSYSQGSIPKSKMSFISGGYYTPVYTKKGEEKQKVNSFYLDTYAVTVEEFTAFVKANPKWRRSEVKRLFADGQYLKNWKNDLEPGENINPKSPVTYVSWFAAKAYAAWVGKRLPTTVEWEYVCASDDKNIEKELQWFSEKSTDMIARVGSSGKNDWKVYDMTGLIWEWTYDFNNALLTGDSREENSLNSDLFCGSGAGNAKDVKNYPAFMRYGFRTSLKANYTVHNLGFRCAKDIEEIKEAKR